MNINSYLEYDLKINICFDNGNSDTLYNKLEQELNKQDFWNNILSDNTLDILVIELHYKDVNKFKKFFKNFCEKNKDLL